METIKEFISITLFNNRILDYTILLGILFFGIIIINIFKFIILKHIKKLADTTATTIDNFAVSTIEKTVIPISYFGVFYLASQSLQLNEAVKQGIYVTGILIVTFFIVLFFIRFLNYGLGNYQIKNPDTVIPKGIITLAKAIIWILGILFLLDNLGFEIKTIIAGLSIGGVAMALASQTVLKDLFNCFVILFDKPFERGDFIVVDDNTGVVEKIGLKTTHLRAPGGEQLIISNSNLTDTSVKNFKRMEGRSIIFTLTVSSETGHNKLASIPKLLSDIIDSKENSKLVRAHFKSFGDFGLIFEIQYLIETTDYIEYLDIQQEINLDIVKVFEKENIVMPYPTQVIRIENSYVAP